MITRNFRALLERRWGKGKFVCVGLDSKLDNIPKHIQKRNPRVEDCLLEFNKQIVEVTADIVCAYKPNSAFYEGYGPAGMIALARTVEMINMIAPEIPVILDAKRGDIDNTNNGYIKMAFEYLGVDAITVPPYMGRESLQPFLDQADKGIIALCRTSNKGAGEFQDLFTTELDPWQKPDGMSAEEWLDKLRDESLRLYEAVAFEVAEHWNKNGNCGVVVGATYPEELKKVRNIVGDIPILIPGIGAQGGDVEKTVIAGMDKNKKGIIINSGRSIIFASPNEDFAEAARRETEKLHDLINQYRAAA